MTPLSPPGCTVDPSALSCLATNLQAQNDTLRTRTRDLDNLRSNVANRTQRIATSMRAIEEGRAELQRAQSQGVPVETMRGEIERLRAMDKLLSVRVQNCTLILRTVDLECVNPRTKKAHLIGSMEIRMDIETGGITFDNRTRKVMGSSHPHVHGHACLGNTSEIFPTLIRNGELCAAASVAIGYLETCNPDDHWGQGITNWPPSTHPKKPAARRRKTAEPSPPQA